MVSDFLFTFIPLFVTMDALGNLPILISLTGSLQPRKRASVVRQSILTALIIIMAFILVGKAAFLALGITAADFTIAGGILLLIISIVDIVKGENQGGGALETVGIVPLGTPLIAGPATLTTALLLVGRVGYPLVIISVVLNLLLAWLIFSKSRYIIILIGDGGAKALSKVSSLLLGAIAVRMIRDGLVEVFGVKQG
jgi:multiple antibiotic resistance protein